MDLSYVSWRYISSVRNLFDVLVPRDERHRTDFLALQVLKTLLLVVTTGQKPIA